MGEIESSNEMLRRRAVAAEAEVQHLRLTQRWHENTSQVAKQELENVVHEYTSKLGGLRKNHAFEKQMLGAASVIAIWYRRRRAARALRDLHDDHVVLHVSRQQAHMEFRSAYDALSDDLATTKLSAAHHEQQAADNAVWQIELEDVQAKAGELLHEIEKEKADLQKALQRSEGALSQCVEEVASVTQQADAAQTELHKMQLAHTEELNDALASSLRAQDELNLRNQELVVLRQQVAAAQAEKSTLDKVLAAAMENHKHAQSGEVERLSAEHAAALQQAVGEVEANHIAIVENCRSVHCKEVERLSAEHAATLQQAVGEVEANHTAIVEKCVSAHSEEVERLLAEHASALQQVVGEVEAKHATIVKNCRSAHSEEVERLSVEHAAATKTHEVDIYTDAIVEKIAHTAATAVSQNFLKAAIQTCQHAVSQAEVAAQEGATAAATHRGRFTALQEVVLEQRSTVASLAAEVEAARARSAVAYTLARSDASAAANNELAQAQELAVAELDSLREQVARGGHTHRTKQIPC
jgi:hypothetical protein